MRKVWGCRHTPTPAPPPPTSGDLNHLLDARVSRGGRLALCLCRPLCLELESLQPLLHALDHALVLCLSGLCGFGSATLCLLQRCRAAPVRPL